ncbi:MAG TPA: nuclear transport factor 2 family protein [Gemmatimonadaceae bacterium]|jgi:hypothetical protein|nr:nuclear transport factor 2 family protein [Gemmatimonadaceae bacterium]
MNRILHLASLIATTACASASLASAQSGPSPARNDPAEERAVLAVVQRMFDAMRTRDTAAFREIFEPNARLVGMRTRQNGEQVVQAITWERFGSMMAGDTRGTWIERAFNPDVRIRGTLATVWAEYDFHFGQKPSHCGVDAVQLLRTPAGWKIVSIADTYETTGCPTRDVPR